MFWTKYKRHSSHRHTARSNHHLKFILLLFIIVSGVFVVLTYSFYQENQYRISVIQSQTVQIGLLENLANSLNTTVHKQADTIEGQGLKINTLKNDVSTLNAKLDIKTDELGRAQNEIRALRPIVKNYYAAAVRNGGSGIIIPISVKVVEGTGIISTNIKNIDLLPGTQESVRTAVKVADQFTGISTKNKDITVSFENEGNEIISLDGPSAGAAVTTTIIAALLDKNIKSSIMMTGTIETTWVVGQVGGVLGKAVAAKDRGATKFLVPQNQGISVPGITVQEVTDIAQVVEIVLS